VGKGIRLGAYFLRGEGKSFLLRGLEWVREESYKPEVATEMWRIKFKRVTRFLMIGSS